jgi:hypothetical protein
MRATWNLPELSLPSLPRCRVQDVLVEYDGPQIVTAVVQESHFLEPHPLYLGVASDDGEGGALVRWILAPITDTELEALIDGAVTLRDLMLKAEVYVLDVAVEYDWEPRRGWVCDGHRLEDEHLPARGALLATASRREFLQKRMTLPQGPELRIDGARVGEMGVGFRALSKVFDVFQRLWNAFAESMSPGGPKASGRPRAELAEKAALGVAAAAPGSLVLQISPADIATYQEVAERFEMLVGASGEPTALASAFGRLGPRVQGRYIELLATLARHDLQMLARRPGGAAFLSATMSSRVLQEWQQGQRTQSSQIDAIGHFTAFDIEHGSFTFYDEHTDETYSGSVAPDAQKSVTVGEEVRYVVALDVTITLRARTERASESYALRSITQISRPPPPAW